MAKSPAFLLRRRLNLRRWLFPALVYAAGAAIVVAVGVAAALAQAGAARVALPPQLEAARERLTLEQTGSPAFHLEAEFEVMSDTGAVSRGTFSEDWWTDLWWRQVTVVNGLRRDVVQIGGRMFRDEDDGFLLPFRGEALLLALRKPFPEKPQMRGSEGTVTLGRATLHCETLPIAAEGQDVRPAPKTFCVNQAGDLRLTADPNYRVLYNDVAPAGSHFLARSVSMIRLSQTVGSLHVLQYAVRSGGPETLQRMSMDDQVRFAVANPRVTLLLRPLLMERQTLSTDVRLMAQSGTPLLPQQSFAIVHMVEANGRLLDAEVLVSSDEATRALAIRILRTASFRVSTRQARPYAYEGTMVLAAPVRR